MKELLKIKDKKQTTDSKMSQRPEQTLHQKDKQVTNKQVKRCSAPHVIREMQMETTRTHHETRTGMREIQSPDNTEAGEDVKLQGLSFITEMAQPLGKTIGQFLTK